MTTPPIIDIHQKFGFGGPRSTNLIQAVFIHTTENPPTSRAIDIGNWQAGGRATGNTGLGSYHFLADRSTLVFCNTDDWIAHGTGNRGNTVGLHLSFVARAAMSRAEWLAEESNHGTLSRGAWKVADWCKKHNIPIQFVNGVDLRAGRKGISTHNEARIAWGGTTHTDPGPGFPMDVFVDLVRKHATPTPIPKKEESDMAADLDTIITAMDGTRHKARDLIAYTDGRVFELHGEVIPRLEKKLDEQNAKLDAVLKHLTKGATDAQ